jgi:hypothetical protein
MNYRRRSRLVLPGALLMLSIMPDVAVAGWRLLPTTGFVNTERGVDANLDLFHGVDFLWAVIGGFPTHTFSIFQGVPVVEGDVIDAVAVCYRADPGTYIRAIALVEFLVPGAPLQSSGTEAHYDDTQLSSTTNTCYLSPVADYPPAGAVTLRLLLKFSAVNDVIVIGAAAVHVK